jgi:hypothetical protein
MLTRYKCVKCDSQQCTVGVHVRPAKKWPWSTPVPTHSVVCDTCKSIITWIDPPTPKPYTLIFEDGRIKRIEIYDLEVLRMTHDTIIIIEGHPKINEEIFKV